MGEEGSWGRRGIMGEEGSWRRRGINDNCTHTTTAYTGGGGVMGEEGDQRWPKGSCLQTFDLIFEATRYSHLMPS